MKVLLINGSPHANGCTAAALAELCGTLELCGMETEVYHIGTRPISGCIACHACERLGKCAVDDGVNTLIARLDEFDALVVGSPVYYAGPAGQLCAFLDRLFYAGGAHLAGKPAACVVSCRRGGASAAFDRLNKYFTINSLKNLKNLALKEDTGRLLQKLIREYAAYHLDASDLKSEKLI